MKAIGVVVLALAASAHGATPREPFAVGAPAPWVEPIAADTSGPPPETGVRNGIHQLLLDVQVRVGPGAPELYRHAARAIVNEAGLEAASQVTVDFDPSYQSLTLHRVRLRRGGAVLDRLDPSRVKVLQREPDLESQIYDGTLSVVLFVEDLRVGDVVETAYTVRGANPVFEGRFAEAFELEWSSPVRHLRRRLVVPAGRPFLVRDHGTSLEPTVRGGNGTRELLWEAHELPAVPGEADVPAGYDVWGWAQATEWQSWAEVAEWGVRLFPLSDRPPASLAAQVERWRALGPMASVHAALRFVQDEVRYLGIEMGPSAQRPHPPELVARQRFGDCKDKVLLFCTLARALGASAWPALVNTRAGRSLDEWLPTPHAFDHAVAVVGTGDRRMWVDPTLTAQGGGPGQSDFPDYERALVLRPGTTDLTAIEVAVPKEPTKIVRERYVAASPGAPAQLEVETRFLGREADGMRYDLRRRSRDDMARAWLKYYSQTFPKIKAAAPVAVEDDRIANRLVTRERYDIPEFWAPIEGESGRREAEVEASTLYDVLRDPPSGPRSGPVLLSHPTFVRHVTEIELPDELFVTPDAYDWSAPELRFHYRSTFSPGSLVAEYEYESRRDRVAAARVATHLKTMGALRSYLRWRFEHPPRRAAAPAGPNWPVLLTAALVLALGAMGAALAWRRTGARGSGGGTVAGRLWPRAVVAAAALLVSAGLLVVGLFRARHFYAAAGWTARTVTGGVAYHAAWAPFLLAALSGRLLLLVAVGFALLLLVRGRRGFRLVFAGLASGLTVLLFAEGIAFALLAGGTSEAARAAGRDAFISLPALFLAVPAVLASRRLE